MSAFAQVVAVLDQLVVVVLLDQLVVVLDQLVVVAVMDQLLLYCWISWLLL